MMKLNKFKFLAVSLVVYVTSVGLLLAAADDQEDDVAIIFKATTRLQLKLKSLNENNEKLSGDVEQQKGNLTEADNLISLLLNPSTTPTTINFLRAVYRDAPQTELQELYRTAVNKKEIFNIITDGHTKFRADAPEAHLSVLRLCGLLNNLVVTDDFATVEYSKLEIPGSPGIRDAAAAVGRVSKRVQGTEEPAAA